MWTVDNLRQYLKDQGVPDDCFGLYQDKDDAICVEKRGNEWFVYYSERGEKSDLGYCKTESQALDVLRLYVIEEWKKMGCRWKTKGSQLS